MNRRTILTKTGKGLMEATGKSSNLSRDLRDILKEIDGTVSVSELLKKFEEMSEREIGEALRGLVRDGYVREFIGQQDAAPRAPTGRSPTPPASAGAGEDLDFTDFTPAKPSARTSEDVSPLVRDITGETPVIRMREEAAAKAEAQARTQAEALDQARREAEERQRRDAEEKARREAEARARIDAEQAAKRDAEGRGRSEPNEKTRWGNEAEDRARREAEVRARREEAERVARIEAETRAKVEAEMRARRELEERMRREQEARREEDERKRRDAEETEALMRSLREQEEKVQREAEQREREERERREEEERARRESEEETRRQEEEKRNKEKEKRIREEEKKRADSEAEEAAQVRKAARAKEQAARGKQETPRDSGAAARSARRAWAKRKPGNFVRQFSAMLLVLLVVLIAVVPFVPLEPGRYEKAAQAWLGEPVEIGTFSLTLLPIPQLKFGKVVIGKEPQIRVATIRATPQIGSMLAGKKALRRLELENVTFPREYLSALLRGKGRGESLGIEHLTAKGLKLDIPELNLPALELDASFSPDGALKSVTVADAERKLSVKLQPQGGKAAIEISSDKFPLAIGADLALGEFTAKGAVTRSELVLNEAEARAFGGRLSGSARLRWSDGWSLEGQIAARQMDASKIVPSIASGTLEGRGVYSMRARLPERLLMNARLEGNFTVQKGSIANIDMTRLLQGTGSGGGTTPFSEMSGGVSANTNRVLVRQIRMVAGLLSGAGQVEMDAQKNLSGRLQIELRARTVQARATLAVAGTLKDPQFRRTN